MLRGNAKFACAKLLKAEPLKEKCLDPVAARQRRCKNTFTKAEAVSKKTVPVEGVTSLSWEQLGNKH